MNVYTYSFKVFWATKTFGRDIYNGTITLKEADKTQIDLLIEILNFKKRIKPHNLEIFLKTYMHYLMLEKVFMMLLKAKYFQ